MERDFSKKRKPVALPVAILSILILLLSVLLAF
jgi:hypothetical protein